MIIVFIPDKTEPLACVGQSLQMALKEKELDILAHATYDCHFDSTFLMLNDANKTWQFCGVPKLTNLSKNFKLTVNNLLRALHRNKVKEIEKIYDISTWLRDPARGNDPRLYNPAKITNGL